jgi:hypothetical protein
VAGATLGIIIGGTVSHRALEAERSPRWSLLPTALPGGGAAMFFSIRI